MLVCDTGATYCRRPHPRMHRPCPGRVAQALTDKAFGGLLLLIAALAFSYYTLWVVVSVRTCTHPARVLLPACVAGPPRTTPTPLPRSRSWT